MTFTSQRSSVINGIWSWGLTELIGSPWPSTNCSPVNISVVNISCSFRRFWAWGFRRLPLPHLYISFVVILLALFNSKVSNLAIFATIYSIMLSRYIFRSNTHVLRTAKWRGHAFGNITFGLPHVPIWLNHNVYLCTENTFRKFYFRMLSKFGEGFKEYLHWTVFKSTLHTQKQAFIYFYHSTML